MSTGPNTCGHLQEKLSNSDSDLGGLSVKGLTATLYDLKAYNLLKEPPFARLIDSLTILLTTGP